MKAKQEWIDLATQALDKAYVPYSHFPVGACLVCEDGTLYQGERRRHVGSPSAVHLPACEWRQFADSQGERLQ